MAKAALLCVDKRYKKKGGTFVPALNQFMNENGIDECYSLHYPGASLAIKDPGHYASIKKTLGFLCGHGVDTLFIIDHLEGCVAFVEEFGEMAGEDEINIHLPELQSGKAKLKMDFPSLIIPTYYHDSHTFTQVD